VPSQDNPFAYLDQLFDSLGYEMQRGAPELGQPASERDSGGDASGSEDGGFEPSDDSSGGEESGAEEALSEDEMLIEEMLSELDSPSQGGDGGTSSDFMDLGGSGGGDYMDLGGGSPSAPAAQSQWDEAPAPAAQSQWDEAPEPVTAPEAPPEPEPEPEPEPDYAPQWDEGPGPAEEAASEPAEETPALDDFGSDFEQELEGVGDLGALEETEAPFGGDESVPDDFPIDSDEGVDDEMGSFLEELEAAEVSDEDASLDAPLDTPPAGDDFDLGGGFSELPEQEDSFSTDLGDAPAAEDEAPADDFGGDSQMESPFAADTFSSDFKDEGSFDSAQSFDDLDLGFGAGAAVPTGGDEYAEEPIELNDEDLQRIRKRMMIMTPLLRELTSRAIAEDAISQKAQNRLIRMLLNKDPLDEVRVFLENETGESAAEEMAMPEAEAFEGDFAPDRSSSRVPAYGSGGHARDTLSNIWPMLRIGGLAVAVAGLGLLLYLLLIRPGMTGSDLMERGLASIGDEEYSEAEDYFKRGEAYLGKEIEWYRKYAGAYRAMREPGRAIRKIREGLGFAPRDFDSLMLLGDTYTDTKDFDAAQETFKQMERYFPDNLKVPEKMGDVYIAMGDDRKSDDYYELARVEYEKIIDKEWKNLDGQFKTLLAYTKMRNLDAANEKYAQIQRIDKKALNIPVLTEYAGLLQDDKKWYESRTILNAVLEKDWQYAPAHFRLSKYFREQLDFGRAVISLNNAVRLDKNNAVYHNEMGEVLLSSPHPDIPEAMQSFTLARELDPDFQQPYVNLGHIYYDLLTPGDSGDLNLEERNYEQALENYESALRRMPANFKDEKFFYNLGWLYYRKNRYEDAVTSWQRLYTENPFHPVVSFSMGNAWLHMGRDELAEAEYDKVVRYYETIASHISYIDPDLRRHKNVFGMLVNSYNNLGVAWEMRNQRLGDPELEKRALMSFWKARELADRLNKVGFEFPENNIRYILHRDYRNRELAIAPELGAATVPKFLDYEKQ